jgi:hypothetical protein
MNVFGDGKNIATGMAVDKQDLTLRSELELGFQALNVILICLPLGQDLTDEAEPVDCVEPRDLCGRLMQGPQKNLCGIESARSDTLQKDLQRIIPHFPFRFAKNQFQEETPVLDV